MNNEYTTVNIKYVPRIYKINTDIQDGNLNELQFSANWVIDVVTDQGEIIATKSGGLTTIPVTPERLAAAQPIIDDINAQMMADFLNS